MELAFDVEEPSAFVSAFLLVMDADDDVAIVDLKKIFKRRKISTVCFFRMRVVVVFCFENGRKLALLFDLGQRMGKKQLAIGLVTWMSFLDDKC